MYTKREFNNIIVIDKHNCYVLIALNDWDVQRERVCQMLQFQTTTSKKVGLS